MHNKMKKILFISLALLALASCSNDDFVPTPLDSPILSEGEEKSVSTLTFHWNKVADAVQYVYELRDMDGELVTGNVTTATSLAVTYLQPNTTYTLTVWALAAVGGPKTTSPIATLTATTNAQKPLITPDLDCEIADNIVTISWPVVEGAEWYTFILKDAAGAVVREERVTSNNVSLSNLEDGQYSMTVTAESSDENFCPSEAATVTFDFQRIAFEGWTGKGTMTTPTGQTYAAVLHFLNDGSYVIPAFAGVEGYDLCFKVAEGELSITNATSVSGGYYTVPTGDGGCIKAYPEGFSGFEGDQNKGKLWFYAYVYDASNNELGSGYYVLEWEAAGMTIDDLCGTYTETTNCLDLTYDFVSWTAVSGQQSTVMLTKIDDTHLNIYNFYGWKDNFTATVDLSHKTLTVDIKPDFGGYYGFALETSQDAPVVGTILEDGSIEFKGWTLWYSGNSYVTEAVSVLKR